MPVERCTVPECVFVSNDYPPHEAIESLRLHMHGAHPALFVQPVHNGGAAGPKTEKAVRPTLHIAGPTTDEESWSYFIRRWEDYKLLAAIPNDSLNLNLRYCLPDEVGKSLFSRYGDQITQQTEAVLLDNVKKMVVSAKNVLTSVVELRQDKQEMGQSVESFLSKLKVIRRGCNLKAKCMCNLEVDYSDNEVLHCFQGKIFPLKFPK